MHSRQLNPSYTNKRVERLLRFLLDPSSLGPNTQIAPRFLISVFMDRDLITHRSQLFAIEVGVGVESLK